MKKKKQAEVVEWGDLQIGDFIECNYYRFFCFRRDSTGPSCLGRQKGYVRKQFNGAYVGGGILEYRRMKPTKPFIKVCRTLLDFNFKEYNLDNLSYIEALAALKKYD